MCLSFYFLLFPLPLLVASRSGLHKRSTPRSKFQSVRKAWKRKEAKRKLRNSTTVEGKEKSKATRNILSCCCVAVAFVYLRILYYTLCVLENGLNVKASTLKQCGGGAAREQCLSRLSAPQPARLSSMTRNMKTPPPPLLRGGPCVSSSDQKNDLQQQADRLKAFAFNMGVDAPEVVTEVGSGMNDKRRKLNQLLADPTVTTIIVEHRDRLAQVNAGLVESALKAQGRRILVVDDTELDDDLVQDMTEALTSFCARLYGRRGAKHKATAALEAAHRA